MSRFFDKKGNNAGTEVIFHSSGHASVPRPTDPLAVKAIQLAKEMECKHNYTALDGFNEAVTQTAASKKDSGPVKTANTVVQKTPETSNVAVTQTAASKKYSSFVTTANTVVEKTPETSAVVDEFSPPGTPRN